MNAKIKQILAVSSTNGRRHDFRQFKEIKLPINSNKQIIADTGYQGLQKLHSNTLIQHKNTFKKKRNQCLTQEQKLHNRQVSSRRILIENVICRLKVFKIISDKYTNRRNRFGLRFSFDKWDINYELEKVMEWVWCYTGPIKKL